MNALPHARHSCIPSPFALATCLGTLLLVVSWHALASAQIKPRIVVGVDTSGSMIWDLSGKTTYGDGVGRRALPEDPAESVREGVYYGCGTTAGLDRDCDGFPNDSRMAIAKDAIRKLVLGYGDVDWSLAKFRQIHALNKRCLTYNGSDKCDLQAYGNPQCNTGAVDNVGCVDAVPLLCRPGLSTTPSLRRLAAGNSTACVNYGFDVDSRNEEQSCLGADVLVGFTGLGAFEQLDNRPALLRWIDQVETHFDPDISAGDFCRHASGGDCELRPGGSTPLGALVEASGQYALRVRADDTSAACRQYSTILLTDGVESCDNNPEQRAFELAYPQQGDCDPDKLPNTAPAIHTYIVGISIVDSDRAALDRIAACGGTARAYFTSSASQLSAALAEIVNRSIPVEECNGRDDDCDGHIDEGSPRAQPGSDAQPRALFCDGEGQRSADQQAQVARRGDYPGGTANTAITSPVVCGRVLDTCSHPGSDDDCDGKVDEDAAMLTACGTCPGAADGCDGRDNDCDGVSDEIAGSGRPFSVCPTPCTRAVPCGNGVGECRSGVYRCEGGVLNKSSCEGQVAARDEVCDDKDNDCDGVVDNPQKLARECSTPYGHVGICLPGTQLCARTRDGELADTDGYRVDLTGKPVCQGQVLPETRELCDSLDHDCDGDPFTCTQSSCTIGPAPERVRETCGHGVGACSGRLVCDRTSNPPTLRCDAASGGAEFCDHVDNDCDGKVDEELGPAGPCGSSIGECRLGTYVCTANGELRCSGDKTASPEACDALDNDCDGKVDEQLGLGEACGSSVGACRAGRIGCASGRRVCSGEVGPQLETCDCVDNDCDGNVDEQTQTANQGLCPSGSQCFQCQCALPCVTTAELVAPCPQGKAAVSEASGCYCVGEQCNESECAQQTVTVAGEVQCTPDSQHTGACTCKNNACTFVCAGVHCADGLVCDPSDGRCRQSSCLLAQFACAAGQRCALQEGLFQCTDDLCASVTCPSDQGCRDGACFGSCAYVACAAGQRCRDGSCQADACAAVVCNTSEVCDESTGRCVTKGACAFGSRSCGDGQTCAAISGQCAEDPCLRTHCPVGTRCNPATGGQCESRCNPGELWCDTSCVQPEASRAHCGASGDCQAARAGEDCGENRVCSRGQCSDSCAAGWIACAGACIDPALDARFCGASGTCEGTQHGSVCTGDTQCRSGVCSSVAAAQLLPQRKVTRVVAAGGGGFSCSVGVLQRERRGHLWWLVVGMLWLIVRGRRHKRALQLACAALFCLDSGCKVDTFCLDCEDTTLADAEPAEAGVSEPLPDATNLGNLQHVDENNGETPETSVPGTCQPEQCNLVDDDCDGKIDEGFALASDVAHCGGCGKTCNIEHAYNICVNGSCALDRSSGERGCDVGYHDLDRDAANGCEYRCIKTADTDVICDQLDNDCDAKIDEDVALASDPEHCGRCGLRCQFAHAATGASCQAGACVLDDSRCDEGFRDSDRRSITGCEYRCPVWPMADEVCNALDDDCNGQVDEEITRAADARIGVTCGEDRGECRQGVTICVQGSPSCATTAAASSERCDGKDNDCDGTTDEGFDLAHDVANCGGCGQACLAQAGHAVLACDQGQCKVAACIGDYADKNGDFHDGCETACSITGNEVCDGVDNDCNGRIDDDVSLPSVVCAIHETGICAGDATALERLRRYGPRCSTGALSCDVTAAAIAGYQTPETSCDSLDNDCDGKIDEMLPLVGQPCTAGLGACRTHGVYVCDATQPEGYRCNAPPPSAGAAEACDGLDNDCDGVVDNFGTPSADRHIAGLTFVDLGAAFDHAAIMAYEASRPDATAQSAGTASHTACSAAGRRPWANVTWDEANSACCALNPDGRCAADQRGFRLCDASTWQAACEGTTSGCAWAYASAVACAHELADTAYAQLCVGAEAQGRVGCDPGVAACATVTGSPDFPSCHANLAGGAVFDLAGNVKEWTHTAQGTGIYEQRGGSYNNLESGRTCAFDFSVGDALFRFPTTGFRCCYYP